MASSVFRGRFTFEDGSTADDVETFDDGTWINHGVVAQRQREAGQLIRASADKAERQIKIPTTQPCTVMRVNAASGIAGGVAVVHVDGDPITESREVTISSTYQPVAGDRAQLQYNPPHGASIVAPISGNVAPAAGVNRRCGACGGGDVSWEALALTGAPIVFCCEEFSAGGAVTNGGLTIVVPTAGIYSIHFEATTSLTTDTPGAYWAVSIQEVTDLGSRNVSVWRSETRAGVVPIQLGRAGTVLQAGSEIKVWVANLTVDLLYLAGCQLDVVMQQPYGDPVGCNGSGGGGG